MSAPSSGTATPTPTSANRSAPSSAVPTSATSAKSTDSLLPPNPARPSSSNSNGNSKPTRRKPAKNKSAATAGAAGEAISRSTSHSSKGPSEGERQPPTQGQGGKDKQSKATNGKASEEGKGGDKTDGKQGKGKGGKGDAKATNSGGAKKSPLPPNSAGLPDSPAEPQQTQLRPPNSRSVSNSSKGKSSSNKGQKGAKGGEGNDGKGRSNGSKGNADGDTNSTDHSKRPPPIPIPSNDNQPRSVSASSALSTTDQPLSPTSAPQSGAPGQPPVRSLRASISHSRDALDAAREAAGGPGQANINSALNSLQKMISDLKLMPPVPNTATSASSSGSSAAGTRSTSGNPGRGGAKSPLPSQPVSIPTTGTGSGGVPNSASVLSPSSASAKLKPDAPAFTPSSATAASSGQATSPGISLGLPSAGSQSGFNQRSMSHSSEYERDRRTSVSSISTINPYAGLTNPQPYSQSGSFSHGQSFSVGGSFSQSLSPPIGPNPFNGMEQHDLASLMYNDQYQQLLIAQRVQYQQIQLLQAQIGANQLAAQQAQLQAQQSGSFVAPRFRALAEQRQAQQTQQQIAQLGQAQQVYEMQQQALLKVQEAHARAAAQETLKNPPPVFEEDEEEHLQQQHMRQQQLLQQRAKAKELNPAFNFGAKRGEERKASASQSPPMPAQPVIVDRSQGIGGAQATGLAGLAARAHKRTGSELTPAMQQQLEIQSQIEALQAKQKALMEAEKTSSTSLSQLSNLIKSPPAPQAATLPQPASVPPASSARSGHRRIQSSFPSAPGPETHGLSSSFNEGSLLEQRMRGEMPPPPVPSAAGHNRRHSVNVFAKNAGTGSGFGAVDQIPEDEAPPVPSHRRTGSRGASAFEGNWRSNSMSMNGNNSTLASGNVTDLASAQAQLASLAQFRAAAGGGHHRMASFALPNMLPNLLAATTLSAPAGTPDLWRQQQAFQLQLQQSSGTAPSGPQRKSLFAPYLPQASLPPLLQAGKLVVGILRVNKKNRSDAYVATDVLEADIYICGSKDRNRALEGDIVAVELLDVDEVWATKKDKEEKKRKKEENAAYDLKPSTRKQLEKKKDDVEVEGQGLLLVEEEEVSDEVKPMYAGHVVAVVERMPGQLFSGQLGVLRPSSAATKDRQEAERRERGAGHESFSVPAGRDAGAAMEKPKIVWFKPTDKRVPLIAIPTEQAPEDFVADPEKWVDRLFVATIKRWPITSLHPFGNLVEELGPIGDVEVETSALLKDCNFPTEEFAEGAVKCLPPLPWSIPEREYEIRQDIRSERVFTVDPPNAKDLDDALSIKKNDDGSFSVGVHIADVSYFVKPNTALDREARKRAVSVYLVQRAVPMLPPQLCEQLCSLVPDVERLAFSAFFTVDKDGRVTDKKFARTIIKSCAKLSYADAQGVISGKDLDGTKVANGQGSSAVMDDIRTLHEITRKLRSRRLEAGALASDEKLKVSFTLDASGAPVDVEKYERTDAHSMVEELMLLANTSVAHLVASALPEQALLRRHEPPIDRRIEGFVRRAKQMGFELDASTAGALQKSFEAIKDKEALMCLEMMKKKAMTAAKYFCTGMLDIAKYSHWALNTPLYTHFTSPIRRYADVIVHRMLDSVLTAPNQNDVKFLMDRDQVAKISQQCNMKKAGSKLAEQQSVHLHLCMLIYDLTEKYGPVIRQGKVTGVLDSAFDLVVPEFAIEKRVHVDKLPLDNTVYDEHRNTLALYWTQKDVLSFLAETTDEPAIKSIVSRPSPAIPESTGLVAQSKQYQKSADRTPPAFDKSTLREPASGHKIQDIKELDGVPVLVCADVGKSPPVLMVYAVNPFAA